MRHRGRIDANQQEIVDALETAGCSILHTSNLGNGAPDLCVGLRGQNFLLEIKDPAKPPSARRLTAQEKNWHLLWRGQVDTVYSKEDALRAVGLLV